MALPEIKRISTKKTKRTEIKRNSKTKKTSKPKVSKSSKTKSLKKNNK
jgi:hypothetical protein